MTTLLTRTPPAPSQGSMRMPAGEPAAVFDGTAAERLVLVVAPTTGRFQPVAAVKAVGPDSSVAARCVLGHVTGGRGRADAVMAPTAGSIQRLLVRPGQLVCAGQALVWIERPVDDIDDIDDIDVTDEQPVLAAKALR